MRRNSWPTKKNIIKKIVITVCFAAFCFIWIFPLIWVLNGSLKGSEEWITNPRDFFPSSGYTLENFSKLFFGGQQGDMWDYGLEAQPVGQWLFNSLLASVAHTILYLIIASLAAYAFTFLKFKGKNILFTLLVASMVVPGIVITTPQFENIINLGLSTNILAIILPGLGGISGVFLIKQFFAGIPKDLIESARIDGKNDFQIYLTLVLPLAKSALIVQGLFSFMSVWNDYTWAQIVLGYGEHEIWTLQLGLTYLIDVNRGQLGMTGLTLAASMVSIIPLFIVYLFAQKRIIEGVAMTGLKQ